MIRCGTYVLICLSRKQASLFLRPSISACYCTSPAASTPPHALVPHIFSTNPLFVTGGAQFAHYNREISSRALYTALMELWGSFGGQEIDDGVLQQDWAYGGSQGPGGGGNLNFSIPPKPLRMRFCAQRRHCQDIHVVLCAAAEMQRLLHAHKRRGGGGAILRPERAKNRLQTLPERGPG